MPCVVENLNEGLAKKLCLSVKKPKSYHLVISFVKICHHWHVKLLVMIPQIPQSYNNQLSQSNRD